jgi:hypothetical protein
LKYNSNQSSYVDRDCGKEASKRVVSCIPGAIVCAGLEGGVHAIWAISGLGNLVGDSMGQQLSDVSRSRVLHPHSIDSGGDLAAGAFIQRQIQGCLDRASRRQSQKPGCVAGAVFCDTMLVVPEWRNWQTRCVQVAVLAREWRFESSFGHQIFTIYNRFY